MYILITALLGAAFLYYAGLSIYRITLHPLAKYPGPLLNAISEWPQAIFNIQGKAHLKQYQLHQKYGNVVRVAPNVLLFGTANAAHEIYDRKANVIKTGWTDVSLEINPTKSTHVMNDRVAHAKRRRMLANCFSESALRNQEYLIIDRIKAWCGVMAESASTTDVKAEKKGWGQARDMSVWANNLTLDVLGELCFGKTFGAIEAGTHMAGELLLSSASMNTAVSFIPHLPITTSETDGLVAGLPSRPSSHLPHPPIREDP
jgi:cytochrome P450